MKLTRSAAGFRWRRESWPEGHYVDVKNVTMGAAKACRGVDHNGKVFLFATNESETDWIRIGSTTKLKRKRS